MVISLKLFSLFPKNSTTPTHPSAPNFYYLRPQKVSHEANEIYVAHMLENAFMFICGNVILSPAKLSPKKTNERKRNPIPAVYFCTHRTHLIALWLQTRNKKTHDIFNAQFIFLFIVCQMKLAQLNEGPRRKLRIAAAFGDDAITI